MVCGPGGGLVVIRRGVKIKKKKKKKEKLPRTITSG